MTDIIVSSGIEASFVSSWKGWDEMDTSDLYFYDVELLPDVFPAKVYEKVKELKDAGQVIDLGVWGQTSIIELSSREDEEPFFTSKVKLTLTEEVE